MWVIGKRIVRIGIFLYKPAAANLAKTGLTLEKCTVPVKHKLKAALVISIAAAVRYLKHISLFYSL